MATNDKNQPQITARLEVIEPEPEAPKLELTPEQIQTLEIEKAALVGELRAKAAAEPRPAPRPAEIPEIEEPTVVTTPELEEASHAVEAADAELRAVAEEERLLEHNREETRRADEAVHVARRLAMQQKRNDAEKKLKHLERIAAGARLKALTEQMEIEEARERERAAQAHDEKIEVLNARIAPKLEAAKRVLAVLKGLWLEHQPGLRKLALMYIESMPSTWPVQLRKEFQDQVCFKAAKLVDHTHFTKNLPQRFEPEWSLTLRGLETAIQEAHAILARKDYEEPVADVLWRLDLSAEYERAWRDQIQTLQGLVADFFERAGTSPLDIPEPINLISLPPEAPVADVASQTRAWLGGRM